MYAWWTNVGLERLVERLVGAPEGFVHVAPLHPEIRGEILFPVFVDGGRSLRHGFLRGQGDGQELVLHVDQGEGLLGDPRRFRGHGRDLIPDEPDFLVAEGLLVGHEDSPLGGRGIFAGRHAQDPGQALGLGRVNGADPGVGMGASKHLSVRHTGQPDVGQILGVSRRLDGAVDGGNPLADQSFLTHGMGLLMERVVSRPGAII